jgi:nucleoside-diphosphate-sugar epimerase
LSKIIVTGGSGKAGRACVKDLLAHGYEVLNVDRAPPSEKLCDSIAADLTDFGQTIGAFSTMDFGLGDIKGVVHLAAIPAPMIYSDQVTFTNNTVSTYNVFEAARLLGIKDVVWASSESIFGLPFDVPPAYLPLDEEAPALPNSSYSMSKLLGEEMAKQFCRWDPSMKIVGLRFSNIMEPKDYEKFPGFDEDPRSRMWNIWGYIDARDAAQAIRKAIEAPFKGAEVFIIANAETVMSRGDQELISGVFPNVPLRKKDIGRNETLLSIDKAKRMLGYQPEHSWRNPTGQD